MANPSKSKNARGATANPPPPREEDTPKYTWAQLDATFGAPSDAERAVYDIPNATESHRLLGTEIASARILTDAQRWLGQLHDFLQQRARPTVVGFDEGLARVFASRVKRLRTLVRAAEGGASTRKLRRSAAEAIADTTVRASRGRYRDVHAALSGAVAVDPARRAQVAALRSEPGVDALARDLRALASLLDAALRAGGSLKARLTGRGLDDAITRELEQLASQVDHSLDGVSGASHRAEVSQSEIDLEDGVILTLAEELMGLFPKGRGDAVPALLPKATRRYFSASARRRAPTPAPAPENPVKPV
jgi:hypothetical protein